MTTISSQGREFLLNSALGNLLRTPPKDYPIHGLVAYDSRWEVLDVGNSDAEGAFVAPRLECYKYPGLQV